MSSVALGLSIASILFSFITLVISILALSYVVGLKNSTHKVQYIDPFAGDVGEKLGKALDGAEEFYEGHI